ncbi:FAM184 domain-containing protein [Caenorhabditis elegans]|uniref:FAM184 domain-containing protein n=1 Tax=Caenorhabditis elegans TaxID=6239 RepID=O62366_CAEEL|nr:FAM184 domain-containing protein [Caenorhabditis elegans]CAB04700.3 FAM184 domain-containing protein [Caenorhabditis elegans]|eukprot:NP_493223.3 Uncharacterized protein CELE_T06G6.4 [Caenorhabditis elegans]
MQRSQQGRNGNPERCSGILAHKMPNMHQTTRRIVEKMEDDLRHARDPAHKIGIMEMYIVQLCEHAECIIGGFDTLNDRLHDLRMRAEIGEDTSKETEDKLRVDLSKTIGVLDFLTRDLESKGKSLEILQKKVSDLTQRNDTVGFTSYFSYEKYSCVFNKKIAKQKEKGEMKKQIQELTEKVEKKGAGNIEDQLQAKIKDLEDVLRQMTLNLTKEQAKSKATCDKLHRRSKTLGESREEARKLSIALNEEKAKYQDLLRDYRRVRLEGMEPRLDEWSGEPIPHFEHRNNTNSDAIRTTENGIREDLLFDSFDEDFDEESGENDE